ncbi:MAG: family transcriptional regulator, regulator of embCAB operon [Kribbellaceae bacterium]|nr:family transcriptional regulator, regulator of embCAB operon [Kribbellaceae bacterium]
MGTGIPPYLSHEAPRASAWKVVLLKFLGAAVPVVTVGLGGWLMTGLVAIKRRSAFLGLSAVGYLAVTAFYIFYVLASDEPELTNGQVVATMVYLLANVLCAFQAAVVIGSPLYRKPKQNPYFLQPQQPPRVGHPQAFGLAPDPLRRSQARQLAAEQPALARSLGIGRPDLGRQYDDGGLIDLNDAPADLIDTLPGITGRQAAAIVVSRAQQGRFRLVDELWTRGLLPPGSAPEVADRLVIIDVQDFAG